MTSEIERLVVAVDEDAELRQALMDFGGDFAGLVQLVNVRGFSVTAREVAELLCCVGEELPDAVLDHVAGGTDAVSTGLQSTMDRRSRTVQTLSNVMSSISSTQGTLVDNLK